MQQVQRGSERSLFLDCDGVLANFDALAERIFGQPARHAERRLGGAEFWKTLRGHPDFYFELPLMEDAQRLVKAVAHHNPTILTGCPAGGWAESQKIRWAAKHFPSLAMITCRSVDKRLHMRAGDVLVDDRLDYRHLWEEAGGVFVHHRNAEFTLGQLVALGFTLRPEQEWQSAGCERNSALPPPALESIHELPGKLPLHQRARVD